MRSFIILWSLLCFCCSVGEAYPKGKNTQANSYSIPFELVDNLIIVLANINGKMGKFIFDTGAPELVLNAQYYEGSPIAASSQSAGINGKVQTVEQYRVKAFEWFGLERNKFQAKVIDLHHIELRKNINLHGLIGYKIFRNFEVVIDYHTRYLELWRLDDQGNRLAGFNSIIEDSVNFNMKGHLAYLNAEVNDQNLRLALDSGAEVNLIDHRYQKRLGIISKKKNYQISGVGQEIRKSSAGRLPLLKLQELTFPKLDVLLFNMAAFNARSGIQLDGILGYGFLSRGKFAINYKKKRLYVLRPEDAYGPLPQPLSDCSLSF